MAGMGIRAYELARALARERPVRFVVPNPVADVPATDGLEVVSAPPEAIGRAVGGCTAAVVSGHAANHFFHQVPDVPAVVDLYDPFFIENLHYARLLGSGVDRHDRATLGLALARGDHFLCASAEQRLFYAGEFHAIGRLDPHTFADDPMLARILSIVPFGVPEEPAAGDGAPMRALVGAGPSDPVLLFGGIYDWYDPTPLLVGWPALSAEFKGLKLLFAENPNPESTPQEAYRRAVERAEAIGALGRGIFFLPWQPYRTRANLYAAASLQVVACRPGLEAELSYRTRLLDAAWGGVPFVSAGGGSLARELERAGAGRDVPAGDAAGLLEAIRHFLRDAAAREQAAAAARRYAAERTWAALVAPLKNAIASLSVSPGRLPLPVVPPVPSRLRRLVRTLLG